MAAGLGVRQLKNSRSSLDYHDWQMWQLERTAAQRLQGALGAAKTGDATAQKQVQRCAIMLDNIRQLRITASRMR